jgi:peptide/nickel transport system permease protein
MLAHSLGGKKARHGPVTQHLGAALQGPSATHLLGTDQYGRDLWARVVYGGRLTLEVAATAVAIALIVGAAIGLLAAMAGGWTDAVLMRALDIVLAFPYLLLAIAVVTALGPGSWHAAFAIGVWLMPSAARVARASALELKPREFVDAAYALGATRLGVVFRHIVPNAAPTLGVFATVAVGRAVILEAALDFLGLGAQPPQPSWGAMISSGRDYLLTAPMLTVAPGCAIVITVVALNLVGNRLQRRPGGT